MTFRRSQRLTFTDTATTWTRLLNVPPADADGMRGYVEITSDDGIVQIRATTTVQVYETAVVYLAGPGEPARIPVDRYGVDLDVRPVLITDHAHGADGVPTVDGDGVPVAGGTCTVVAAYRPDGEPRDAHPPRVVAREDLIPGAAWPGASAALDWRIALGPPGLWQLARWTIQRVVAGGGPNATQFSAVAVALGVDYSARFPLEYNNAAANVGTGKSLRTASSTYGGSAPRWDYSGDGWATSRIVLNAHPADDEVYRLVQVYTFRGLALPSPSGVAL